MRKTAAKIESTCISSFKHNKIQIEEFKLFKQVLKTIDYPQAGIQLALDAGALLHGSLPMVCGFSHITNIATYWYFVNERFSQHSEGRWETLCTNAVLFQLALLRCIEKRIGLTQWIFC